VTARTARAASGRRTWPHPERCGPAPQALRSNFGGPHNHNLLIVAVSLSFGLIPTIQPAFYQHFPADFQVIFGSSITSTVIVVFLLNLVFNHWWPGLPRRQGAVETAIEHGAVVGLPQDSEESVR
jgi:hypothetical protein